MKKKNYIYKCANGILCAFMIMGNVLPIMPATTEIQSICEETDNKITKNFL